MAGTTWGRPVLAEDSFSADNLRDWGRDQEASRALNLD